MSLRACSMALAAAWGLWGCAGAVTMARFSGACAEEHAECAAACGNLADDRECLLRCDFEGRMCSRQQDGSDLGRGLARRPQASEDRAFLIDLFGPIIRHSQAVAVETRGDVQPIDGAHAFAPGASLQARFTLPARVREVELILTHAPGGLGTACFVTATVGEQTLLGRYAPPRPGEKGPRLRVETFNLTPMLKAADGPQEMSVFLYNNDNAGSTEPYHLAGVQLTYKVIE